MKTKNLKVRNVGIDEINKHLAFVEKNRKIVYKQLPIKPKDYYSNTCALIEDNPVKFKLTYADGSQVCTYVCRKDGDIDPDGINGSDALRSLGHYTKIPRIENKKGYVSRPFTYTNPKYEGKRLYNCWGYDVNKCYRWAMLQPMPDTSVKPRSGIIKEGKEIGFRLDPDEDNFIMIRSGQSDHIFPVLPESPFKRFIERWSKEKDTAKGKRIINSLSGVLKYTNFFLRAAIVSYARQRMEALIDENTVYCNTDSIVSLVERPDLQISDQVGDFKIEHTGSFVFKDSIYQWNFDLPSWKGVSKARFPKHFDLEVDTVPPLVMPYYYNVFKNRILKR